MSEGRKWIAGEGEYGVRGNSAVTASGDGNGFEVGVDVLSCVDGERGLLVAGSNC